MKVVGIVSSNHDGSNGLILTKELLDGAKSFGAQTELIRLAELQINPCTGCEFCKQENHDTCMQKDGMTRIYESLKTADVIVFTVPVYFNWANGPFMMMINRIYAMIGTGLQTRIPSNKKFVTILTSGGGGLEIIDPISDYIKEIFGTYFGWEPAGVLWQNGLHDSEEVKKFPQKLNEARELGKSLAK